VDLEVGGSIPLSHPSFFELLIIAPGLQFQVNSPVNTMTQEFEAGRSPTRPIPNRQPYPPRHPPPGLRGCVCPSTTAWRVRHFLNSLLSAYFTSYRVGLRLTGGKDIHLTRIIHGHHE